MFGEIITKLRINKNLTLRSVYQKLINIGSSLSLSDYSKIERGIQFPYTKQQFLDIINILDVTDSSEIDTLEKMAMKSNVFRKIDPEELASHFPIFSNIKEKNIDKFLDIIKEDLNPNPPRK